MPGVPKKNSTPAAGPAQWVGGQRRKLVRRKGTNGGVPRSSTMPVLNPESAAASLVSDVSSIGAHYATERQSEDTHDPQQRERQWELEAFEKRTKDHPHGAVMSDTSAPTGGSAKISSMQQTTDDKRKHGLFGTKKLKALDRPNTSTQPPLVTSPLPPSTPSKAAQFFGLEPKPQNADSPHRGQFQDDDISDDALDRKAKTKEEDVDADLPKTVSTSKAGTNKGLRMLIPPFAPSRRPVVQQKTSTTTRFDLSDEDDDNEVGQSSDSNLQKTRFRIPATSRPVAAAPKRRRRKKSTKSLERMSPITEASIEELRTVYRGDEGATELGIISEYEYDDPPYSVPVQSRSRNKPAIQRYDAFELDENDLSPSEDLDDDEVTDDEEHVAHPGTKVEIKRAPFQRPTAVYLRSPLQTAEDEFLDATEESMRLQARKMTLDRIEAEKRVMDAEIATLKREHERLKQEAAAVADRLRVGAIPNPTLDDSSDQDDTDLVSIRSSIDLDEEPTVHEAKVMTFTRITPGMVKLMNIPPRKKKPVAYVGSNTPVPDLLRAVEHGKKNSPALGLGENIPPASPVVTHYHHDDPDCTTKPKKSKLTRDESRLLVQNWVTDYNSTQQRPISTRVDPDVLADQETPPAPFPKSDEDLLTPPIPPRSDSLARPKQMQKHYCINNGHIFHPIDLKSVPDGTVINNLEVRPYLQTYSGIKQHVYIPVLCEKCGADCDENIWECQITVCRMAVCQSCAEDMEAEWQERAVSGWKYK